MAGTGTARPGRPSRPDRAFHRGTNQSGMRDLNERLVLSLVRQHGSLSKAEISQLTLLSAQTVSVIVRALEGDGLLKRNDPVRGKVGQPSVPMSIDPDGAFFLGLKIGRRSAQLALIDFAGAVRGMRHLSHSYPSPAATMDFARSAMAELRDGLDGAMRERIAGIGIAMPFRIWDWADAEADGDARTVLGQWRTFDIRGAVETALNLPAYLQNDATAACGAELVFGTQPLPRDFVYLYIGTFPGGGVVVNGSVFPGPTGNAGAIGSMPVPDGAGGLVQLIDMAAIALLERSLAQHGSDPSRLWTTPEDWGDVGADLDRWIETAAAGLAHAIMSSCTVIDFQLAIIDGWMPAQVRRRLVDATSRAIVGSGLDGVTVPEVREGTVGIHARALGAASLPLAEQFLHSPAMTGASERGGSGLRKVRT